MKKRRKLFLLFFYKLFMKFCYFPFVDRNLLIEPRAFVGAHALFEKVVNLVFGFMFFHTKSLCRNSFFIRVRLLFAPYKVHGCARYRSDCSNAARHAYR